MKTLMTTTLALATLLGAAAATTGTASAIDIRNCTGDNIRVHIYNDDDNVKWFGRNGNWQGAGKYSSYGAGNGSVTLRIFKAQFIDALKFESGGFDAKATYKVVKSGASYKVERDNGGC